MFIKKYFKTLKHIKKIWTKTSENNFMWINILISKAEFSLLEFDNVEFKVKSLSQKKIIIFVKFIIHYKKWEDKNACAV